MLINIRTHRNDDTGDHDGVELLLECHARIRAHLTLARTLAAASGAPPGEVSETAGRVRRYFAEALPLHVEDEDQNVCALLRGHAPDVDTALARMSAEHADHVPRLASLVALCAELERDALAHARLAPELAPVAAGLEAELLAHLELEETLIIPALRALPAAARVELAKAIRARRSATDLKPP